MSRLDAIAVRVEGPGIAADTANALPLLHEIRHALQRLSDSGDTTTLDLSAIPFGPGDRDRLFQVLGEGEVTATLSALGDTHIRESAYPGVWVVRHLNPMGDEIATHIEIARVPSILTTPEADLNESLLRLSETLNV